MAHPSSHVQAAVSGIVLAGGRSSRMGVDKRSLVFEGRPLLAIAVDLLAGVCDDIVVCCRREDPPDPELLAGRRIELAFDRAEATADRQDRGQGPLAGMEAGLSIARHQHCIVIPVDMPRLAADLLERLAPAASEHPEADAVLFALPWSPAPFPGLYRRSVLPLVTAQLDAGRLKMGDLLDRLQVVRLHPGETADSFANVNDPASLRTASHVPGLPGR